MTRRIVLCLSHSIEEHDQLKLLSGIGHDVFSIGGYINPGAPHDDKRPALPEVKHFPELHAAVDAIGSADNLGAAQAYVPDVLLEWADTLIYHHYLDRLFLQWGRIRDWLQGDSNRRVIWRTVGQSVAGNEATARPFRAEGLEIVRYSPKEENIPNFAGSDALIRFYADPEEWKGWTGTGQANVDGTMIGWGTGRPFVANITQHLRQRDPYTNWGFWEQATRGLHRLPAGPGSEVIGGLGALPYDEMKAYLRSARVYLYLGTQPASYTLGLIEAMMTGTPIVSIGPSHMRIFPYGPDLFEGHEIAGESYNDPAKARQALQETLELAADGASLYTISKMTRQRAIDLFGKDKIAAEWAAFLR